MPLIGQIHMTMPLIGQVDRTMPLIGLMTIYNTNWIIVGWSGRTLDIVVSASSCRPGEIPHAFLHCVEVYQPRLLFQVVFSLTALVHRFNFTLQAAVDQICSCQDKTASASKLDTVSDFLTELGRVVGHQSAVIVLEGAERL